MGEEELVMPNHAANEQPKHRPVMNRVATAVKDVFNPAETHQSRSYHRWVKLGADSTVHEIVLNKDGTFVEFPVWEPNNRWTGTWFVTKDENVLTLEVGEYQVQFPMRRDDRGYYPGKGTRAGQAYGEYKLVPLA